MKVNALKVHVLRDLKAYYTRIGRKWWVETKGKKEVFDSFESMIEAHSELMELPVMQLAKERRIKERNMIWPLPRKAPISKKHPNNRTEKIVSCYYCSGKGELFDGVLCPNCHGKQEIRLTTKGIG